MSTIAAIRAADRRRDYRAWRLSLAPLAYWRLGETSGSFQDQMQTYPSVSIGAGVTRGVAGAIAYGADKAVRFPGNATDFVSFGNVLASTFAGTNPFSVMAWVRNTAAPASRWQIITGRINSGGSLTGDSYRNAWFSATADEDGLLTVRLLRGATYTMRQASGRDGVVRAVTVPGADSFELPDIVGP